MQLEEKWQNKWDALHSAQKENIRKQMYFPIKQMTKNYWLLRSIWIWIFSWELLFCAWYWRWMNNRAAVFLGYLLLQICSLSLLLLDFFFLDFFSFMIPSLYQPFVVLALFTNCKCKKSSSKTLFSLKNNPTLSGKPEVLTCANLFPFTAEDHQDTAILEFTFQYFAVGSFRYLPVAEFCPKLPPATSSKLSELPKLGQIVILTPSGSPLMFAQRTSKK